MESDDHRQTDRVYHCINIGEDLQIQQSPGRLPLVKQADVVEVLEDMR